MARIDRFSSTSEGQFWGPNCRITETAVENGRQVRQQRRFNFRDSIGCFETSRLVVPGGPTALLISAKLSLDHTRILHRPLGFCHHSRAAKLVALKIYNMFRYAWTTALVQHACPGALAHFTKLAARSGIESRSVMTFCHRLLCVFWT